MTVYVRETMETVGNWEKQFAREMFRELFPTLREFGKESVQRLKKRTQQQKIKWRGKFERGWKTKTRKWSLVIYNNAKNRKNKFHYGIVIEGGRRRGARMPPPKQLEPWVRDKLPSLVARVGVKTAARIVALSIRKNGIRGRRVMTAFKMQVRFDRSLNRKLSGMWVRAAERSRAATKSKRAA